MPKVTVSVQTANGQTIVLTEGDKLVKEVTIECNSQRCASRHGSDRASEVSLIDGQPMPESGRQWLSLILPETSPQYTQMPPNFCGPSCVKDFLVYDYIAPSSAGVTPITSEQISGDTEKVRKTDLSGAAAKELAARLEATAELEQANKINSLYSTPAQEPESQADGVGEGINPQGPRFL